LLEQAIYGGQKMNNIESTHPIIRWGIIGAGRIAKTFAKDIQHANNASLTAVASRSLVSAQMFAIECDVPRAYGSYAELLSLPDIDAVYIATPHSHHKEQAITALRAGKHVLCEKPATVTPTELEEVINVAQEQERYFMEGMWTYFLPVIKKAQQWIALGRIGNLLHVKADFGFHLPYDPDRREYDNRLAGGCLLEMGIYPIAMAWLFLKQDPDSQSVWHHIAENGVEDDVVVLNRYNKNTATAQLSTSFRCKLPNVLILIGDKGLISISDYWGAREAKLYQQEQCIDHYSEVRTHQGFNYQIESMSQELLAGKLEPEHVSWDDSRAFQRHMANIKLKF
jgi:predicted dehydrogenase